MISQCPWCGMKAVDITTSSSDCDRRKRYLCIGQDAHEWRDGEGPDPEVPPAEPGILSRFFNWLKSL